MHFISRNSYTAGCSGIIFALLGWQSKKTLSTSIPSFYYPIFLIFVIQLLIPSASFVGHLSGLAAGYIYAYGYTDFMIPNENFWKKVENFLVWKKIYNCTRYVKVGQNPSSIFSVEPILPTNNTQTDQTLNLSGLMSNQSSSIPVQQQHQIPQGKTLRGNQNITTSSQSERIETRVGNSRKLWSTSNIPHQSEFPDSTKK
ncbi:hypothetical protein BB559_005784 [Furculomyces boomerangus]|uniref:Peptidase S54 rhomboid domain-containing protein n=2 Tax=Harpellales TaxID=61421 RepID=A0A2T9Y6L5_9FUNG|nr:hypothetical protein BB559_005784 [Furculomyces boomerangus]PVZ99441.1 hypothetical protein BB558_004535 [Smittium angustum]